MKIPFVDLTAQYQSIKNEIDNAIKNVIDETAFIKGKYVDDFERNYENVYGIKHCISCANGTDAIYIALKALGIGPGDEVITVANSWIATAETITQAGAKPVFVDIDPDFFTINVNLIEQKITTKTKAIIPVHIFGQACDMDSIMSLCKKYNLYLIEDCAQAHFAEWDGKRVGTFGDIATFSFFPSKNLGAYGDAGGIVTNNSDLARKMRVYSNHGALKRHEHEIEGINSRMDGIQAAILSIKLKYIQNWNLLRIKNANYYNEILKGIPDLITPEVYTKSKHVYHLYVVRVKNRDKIISVLEQNGIGNGIHYPMPLPFLKAYEYLAHKPSDFPVAYEYKNSILSLPMYPELSTSQMDTVKNVLCSI